MKKWLGLKIMSLTAIIAITGCGVSQKDIDNAQKRVDELKSLDVPDSILSMAKVYLYATKDAKNLGKSPLANSSYDSLKKHLAVAESFYKEKVSSQLPAIQSFISQIKTAKSEFGGMQAKKVDSLLAVVDSLVTAKMYLQASNLSQQIVASIPQLKQDEEKSKVLRKAIPGEWLCLTEAKDTEKNFVEKKTFTFARDGKVKLVESKKGKSGPYLKEDYQFDSWGTYDFAGDTIHLLINRFASVRQNFEKLYLENGKKIWKKEPQPTYDSAITDGSQNRFVTYDDLKIDFKQIKKF
jgi:hypothetical protein